MPLQLRPDAVDDDAGLLRGVNFLPGSGAEVTGAALSNPDFAVTSPAPPRPSRALAGDAKALPDLRSYPPDSGRDGGKDFVVAHPDCDHRGLLVAL